jgi:hypothetical protein
MLFIGPLAAVLHEASEPRTPLVAKLVNFFFLAD